VYVIKRCFKADIVAAYRMRSNAVNELIVTILRSSAITPRAAGLVNTTDACRYDKTDHERSRSCALLYKNHADCVDVNMLLNAAPLAIDRFRKCRLLSIH